MGINDHAIADPASEFRAYAHRISLLQDLTKHMTMARQYRANARYKLESFHHREAVALLERIGAENLEVRADG